MGNSEHQEKPQRAALEDYLRRLEPLLPGPVRYRMLNALEHFQRAYLLLDVDREMASFRAITGEEEAATMLMKAIQLRAYPRAKEFKPRDHQHKAAAISCVTAIGTTMLPMLKEFQLHFNFETCRIDVKVPLPFELPGVGPIGLQPVEPLGLVHSRPGIDEANVYDAELSKLAAAADFDTIKTMIAARANARNTLLYASDSRLPKSLAKPRDLEARKGKALTLIVLSVMVLQSKDHLPLVTQAIAAFMNVMTRLRAEAAP